MTEVTKQRPHVDKGREGKLIPTKVMVTLIVISVVIVLAVTIIFGTIGFGAIKYQKDAGYTMSMAKADAEEYLKEIVEREGWEGRLFVLDQVDPVLVIRDKLVNSYYKYVVKYESKGSKAEGTKDIEVEIEINYETNSIELKKIDIDD
ncbi:MAG TPA: hypothetical protein PKX91_04185 [Clostridia bacterium]|jgi:hypothetical protein|nr:hypothetical protein [Clostridia bacterium]